VGKVTLGEKISWGKEGPPEPKKGDFKELLGESLASTFPRP